MPSGWRDHMALEDNAANQDAIWDLERASGHRLMMEASTFRSWTKQCRRPASA